MSLRSRLGTISIDNDRGVSPVIGVILMVAITVILAAVIGTFVLGLGSNLGSNAQAGFSEDSGTWTVTDISENTALVYCSANSISDPSSYSDTNSDKAADEVGDKFDCSSGNTIIGITEDGSENVIRET